MYRFFGSNFEERSCKLAENLGRRLPNSWTLHHRTVLVQLTASGGLILAMNLRHRTIFSSRSLRIDTNFVISVSCPHQGSFDTEEGVHSREALYDVFPNWWLLEVFFVCI